MSKEIELSQSFSAGNGSVEHNLRVTKGKGVRQNGVMERRHLNEVIEYNPVMDILKAEIGNKLAICNEKHIANNHPERVRTLEQWYGIQQYTRNGNKRKIICDYVLQLGDKYTACPYEIERDKTGNMLDIHGNVINPKDTRHTPAYKNGVITESYVSKRVKKVFREFLKEFKKRNKNARVLFYGTHSDERGAIHCHLTVLWVNKTRNGVGIGLSKTSALTQQYAERGIYFKGTRFDNAQRKFCRDMRLLLKQVAFRHDISKKRMGNTEPHRSINRYCQFADKRSEAYMELEAGRKELEIKEAAILTRERKVAVRERKLKQSEKTR